MTVIALQNKLEVIYVYAEFEVDPTTTVVVVVLNVIPNGFNQVSTFVTNAACVFAEKTRCSKKYQALTDTSSLVKLYRILTELSPG